MFTIAESVFPLLAIFVVVVAAAALLRRVPWFAGVEAEAGPSRLHALDGLRGLLCFGVFAHHAAMTLQQTWYAGDWRAPQAAVYDVAGKGSVALFFCITGFLFWSRLLRKEGKMEVFDFYRGRFLRIVPLYFASALICLIVVASNPNFHLVSWPRLARLMTEIGTLGIAPWSTIQTDAGSIHPEAANAGVVWTLRYEWLFYFALPVLAHFAVRRRWIALYVGWFLALIGFIGQAEAPKVLMFVVGMLAAHFRADKRLATTLQERRFALLSLGCILLTFLLAVPHGSLPALTRSPFSSTSNLLLAGAFVPIACGNTLFGLLNFPSLRFLGTISYSVYLLHGSVLFFARPVLVRFAGTEDSYNLPYWSAILVAGTVVVLVSVLSYRLIESPFIELAQRLRWGATSAPRPAGIGEEVSRQVA